MARNRNAWRSALNSRRLRHAAMTAAGRAAPGLMRRLNYYGAGVAVEQAARRRLFVNRLSVERPLRPDQIDFIQSRSRANDAPFSDDYWRAPWVFEDAYFELEDVVMLGHTGVLTHPAAQAIVTEDGAPENHNRDKAALLREAAPVDGVALPVRRYRSYFHIFFDIALPLVAYFESGAATEGRHVILHTPGQAPFVHEILSALAQAYGAEVRELRTSEKARCRRAVQMRRARPAADWFMAQPETARRLREILLAHFGRAPEPPHPGLYLERGPAKLRNLSNAAAVRAAAERAGLAAFQPAADNFPDQIARCASAQRVFAVHGAALANLLFAEPGCRVVELFGRNFAKSVYLALCQMLGHEHVAVMGGEDDSRQNFAADIPALEAALAG